MSRQITMDTFVHDIVNLIEAEGRATRIEATMASSGGTVAVRIQERLDSVPNGFFHGVAEQVWSEAAGDHVEDDP